MIDIYVYNKKSASYIENPSVMELSCYLEDENLHLWVDFFNPTEDEKGLLKTAFKFDQYAIEDCMHPRQSSKLESFADYHFFIVHGVSFSPHDRECAKVELDGFLGDRYLVTYHDEPVQAVNQVKKNIVNPNYSRLAQGTAYLAYEMLDQIIDMYIPVLDYFDEKVRIIENLMATQPFGNRSAQEYIKLSTQILDLRLIAIKNQQVFYQFSHSAMKFIDPDEARLFRDIYDHTVRVVDMSEYYQQTLRGALDIQFSINTGRVNQIVQFLTIFATIMLPLNVITGLYGMNFDWMPFLHYQHGFWVVLVLMAVIIIVMLYSFRRQGWM